MFVQLVRSIFKVIFIIMVLSDIASLMGWVSSLWQPPLSTPTLYVVYKTLTYVYFLFFFFIFISSQLLIYLGNRWLGIRNFNKVVENHFNQNNKWFFVLCLIVLLSEFTLLFFNKSPKQVGFIDGSYVIIPRIGHAYPITEVEAQKEIWNSFRFQFALLFGFGTMYTKIIYLFLKLTKNVR